MEYLKSIEIVTVFDVLLFSSNHPLFSCIITVYVLVLLYLPQSFSLKIVLSPVVVLTASLLLSLLRLGAIQTENRGKNRVSEDEAEKSLGFSRRELKWEKCEKEELSELITQSFEETFVEWDVGAPLEVIYEASEGEDPSENNDPNSTRLVIERHPSLSLYYPESDSDSSSSETDFAAIGEGVSSERMCYGWEEEDREGLIEIALDGRDMDFHGEEENLIEIDIFSIKA